MGYRDIFGNTYDEPTSQDQFLTRLYSSVIGRMCVRVLYHPVISKLGGMVLKHPMSKCMIPTFIKKHQINMDDYTSDVFESYNEFFIRKIKPEKRPISDNQNILISPSDGRVSVYPISDQQVFHIKNASYTVKTLLRDEKLAKKYAGGYCFLIRLTVDNYHHYCYVDDGMCSKTRRIEGVLHTVNPVAGEYFDIYKENTREYTMLRAKHFGDVIQMEVGALMVGKIVNPHSNQVQKVDRGEEKGYFEFGGSTVIVLVEKDQISPRMDILKNTKEGYETLIKMGEEIGHK